MQLVLIWKIWDAGSCEDLCEVYKGWRGSHCKHKHKHEYAVSPGSGQGGDDGANGIAQTGGITSPMHYLYT